MTLDLDSRVATAIQRRARNLEISEGEFVSRTLYDSLDLGALDQLRNRPPIDVSEEDVLEDAHQELDAYRRERDRPRPPEPD